MTSLFKSKSKTKSEATVVPISYESFRPTTFKVGGSPIINVPNSGAVTAENNRQLGTISRNSLNRNQQQRARLTGTIGRLNSTGYKNDFINARVRPLEERLDNTLADQERAFSRRGVFGSLSENELNKTRFLGEREIGDARALATSESLSQILQHESALSGLTKEDMSIAETRVKDELARVGLSMEALIGLLGSRKQTSQVAGGTVSNSETPSAGSIIGNILLGGKLGGFF